MSSTWTRVGRMEGKIENSGDYLLWTLLAYRSTAEVVYSPYFEFAGRIWGMEIGSTRHSWLFLTLKNFNDAQESDLVTLGLRVDGKYLLRKAAPDESGRVFTANKVIMVQELHGSNTQLLPEGVLTVVCKITAEERKDQICARHQLREKSITKLQGDFQQMLDSGKNSDVVLRVGERDFKAHRNILTARSQVFYKMFLHKMKENITGVVKIQDSDPDVFSVFLHYLYTGSSEKITFENVQELYATADRYQVSELQMQCVYLIEKHLADENIADFINLGLRHNDRELIEAVTRFLSKRAEELP